MLFAILDERDLYSLNNLLHQKRANFNYPIDVTKHSSKIQKWGMIISANNVIEKYDYDTLDEFQLYNNIILHRLPLIIINIHTTWYT